jgi:hypothetical protein
MCSYKGGSTGGITVEKPAETQTSIRLASHLVRVPNSRSGGHEYESPMRRELRALIKSGKTLGVRSFYCQTVQNIFVLPGSWLYLLIHTYFYL